MTTLTPTPIERAMGRFMRAPDHEAGDAPADPPAGDADAAPDAPPADAAGESDGDDTTLMSEAGKAPADGGDGDKGEGDGDKDKAEDADGGKPDEVPEAYDLALPEGVELDAALLEEATPVLKDLGLTNVAANKLTPLVGKVQENILSRQADAHATMAADWAKQAKADPDIGGRNFDASMTNVARVFDRYAVSDDFRKLLNDTKLGNHPEMIRVFAKIGADLKEDTDFVPAGQIPATKASREEILYPNDLPKKKV